jgi:hypothetical protein
LAEILGLEHLDIKRRLMGFLRHSVHRRLERAVSDPAPKFTRIIAQLNQAAPSPAARCVTCPIGRTIIFP